MQKPRPGGVGLALDGPLAQSAELRTFNTRNAPLPLLLNVRCFRSDFWLAIQPGAAQYRQVSAAVADGSRLIGSHSLHESSIQWPIPSGVGGVRSPTEHPHAAVSGEKCVTF